jgi:hypothetical protein
VPRDEADRQLKIGDTVSGVIKSTEVMLEKKSRLSKLGFGIVKQKKAEHLIA